ncbi:MAG: 4a-hydroxytetrahydrobiopterin dehydratase [Thermoanaerobaculia bacterium]
MSTTKTIQTLTVDTPTVAPWGSEEELATPKLKPERVQETLLAAPAWQLLKDGTTLHREKTFPDAMAAMLYTMFVKSLASNLRVPANVKLLGQRVQVTMGSHRRDRRPLTEAQLGLAVMIS